MKKYERTIVSIIVVLVFVVGAFLYFRHISKPASNLTPVKQQDVIPNLAAGIIKSGKIADCKQLAGKMDQGVDYQTVCTNNIAQNTAQTNLDIKACDGLDNKLMSISDCQQSVVTGLINKGGDVSVCDQFTDTLKTSCVNDYWGVTATKKQDPTLCKNLVSSQGILGCQENVLLSSIPKEKSKMSCSLFSGVAETDCAEYQKNNCQAVTFPPLRAMCQKNNFIK